MKRFYLKKKVFLFTFITSFHLLNGQIINENFENENISNWTQSNTNDWGIDTENPITENQSLKHNLTSIAGTSYISQSITELDLNNKNTSWQFNLKNGNWNPSSGNKFWVYLTANLSNLNSEELNGYAIGVNLSGSTDIISLWKVTNGLVDETLITSTITWNTSETKGIKVTRSISGEWSLFIDEDGGFDGLTTAGTPITNTDYLFNDYFGLHFTYTATRAGLLWFDDVLIENNEPSTNPTISFNNNSSFTNETDNSSEVLIPVTLTNYNEDVIITISVAANSTAENEDYIINNNILTFTSNSTQNISITINNDVDFDSETIILNIATNNGDVDLTNNEHTITIIDNDIPIIINEILADPDSTNGDANGDGIVSSSQDEFIEIYNNSNTELDISGWTLDDETKNRHVFPENTIIPINETIVLFSGGVPTNIPGLVQTASSGGLVLNNTGDSIIIKNEFGTEILTETYDNIANDNQSIARNQDLTGDFIKHSEITTNPVLFSPGKINNSNLLFSSGTLSTSEINLFSENLRVYQSSNSDIIIKNLNQDASISLYSFSGKKLFHINITSKNINNIQVPIITSSIYLLKIETGRGETLIKKIFLSNF